MKRRLCGHLTGTCWCEVNRDMMADWSLMTTEESADAEKTQKWELSLTYEEWCDWWFGTPIKNAIIAEPPEETTPRRGAYARRPKNA